MTLLMLAIWSFHSENCERLSSLMVLGIKSGPEYTVQAPAIEPQVSCGHLVTHLSSGLGFRGHTTVIPLGEAWIGTSRGEGTICAQKGLSCYRKEQTLHVLQSRVKHKNMTSFLNAGWIFHPERLCWRDNCSSPQAPVP